MAEDKSAELGHLAARLLSVTLPMGLTLDEVIIQGESIHLQKSPFAVTMPKPGSLEVRVSEGSLADFLNKKAPGGLSGFEIRLADGLITIDAKMTMIISLAVGAVCKLRIDDGTKLVVELVRVEAIGGTGAHNLVQKQLDGINPVLDAKDLPLNAGLESVEIADGWLVIRGTIGPKSE